MNCRQCGAGLLPETSFCRQCGAAIAATEWPQGDERPTTLFGETDIASTQRLDPRPTSPDPARLNMQSPLPAESSKQKKGIGKSVLVSLILVLVIAVVCTLAIVRIRTYAPAASSETLIYPGSRKLMDVVADGGGRVLQLQTSDSFAEVDEWYRTTLKPQKTIQITPRSVVLKNEKTTATIISEDDKTNIVIKTAP